VIAFVEGVLDDRAGDRVVVADGGIGYEVMVSAATLAALPTVGRKVRLLTHLLVRDDAMLLYGFVTASERDLFLMLISVNGVGPKVALAILSVLSADALRRAILESDADTITIVPGVGKKVAARVVLDLKDRLGAVVELPSAGPIAEVREALLGLGLSPQEVRDAMAGLDGADGPVEELLRRALQRVGAGAR
jgi:Holliday junction DNA helicase RuvA